MSIIYHYTDALGFKGVVENAMLWATDFRYLNDSQELIYTWAAFVDKLERLAQDPPEQSEPYRALLDGLQLMSATDLMHFDDPMFVACFSELSDAVSQWTRYGAGGHGVALGFDSDLVGSLKVPQHRQRPDGQLEPVKAIVGGGPSSGEMVDLKWGAFLQKVRYGEAARNTAVDALIETVQQICDGEDAFHIKVGNCVSHAHSLIHRIPLVKHPAFADELEHRITITEHLGGRSLSQKRALSSLGEPFKSWAQGGLETANVRFRPGASTMFKPYIELPFSREALVHVVTGPAVHHQLLDSTLIRALNRNGFRHTEVSASKLPFQV